VATSDTAKAPVTHTTNPGRQTGRDSMKTTPPVNPGGGINVGRASDLLDDLLTVLGAHTVSAAVVRDSAEHIFNASGVARADQAFAAYVTANAFALLDDQEPGRGHKSSALRWARQAVTMSPTSQAYLQLVHDLSGQP